MFMSRWAKGFLACHEPERSEWFMVLPAGIEPAAFPFGGERSNPLSYGSLKFQFVANALGKGFAGLVVLLQMA